MHPSVFGFIAARQGNTTYLSKPPQTSPQKKLVPLGDVVGVFVARAYASACARAVEHAHMHCVVKLRLSRKHEGKSNSNGLNHASQSELENLLICYISNVFTCTSVVSL